MSVAQHFLELTDLAALLRAGAVRSVDVTRAQLDRIEAIDGTLSSYAFVMAESALAEAEAADAEIDAGRYRGPLHGVPIGIKDLCWTAGVPTAAGMAIYRDFRPSEDATVVDRLRQAGAVLLGKLQMTEGAYADHHPLVIPPKNPWNADFWPGISSSGPAAATAAGLCFAAIASDTGGSIRWPCGATGLTGLKPTWGRVSRFGTFELAPSMDHIGPMARSASDAAAMLNVIAGADRKDPTAKLKEVPNYLTRAAQGVQGLRFGVDPVWNGEDVDASVRTVLRDAAAIFRDFGAEIVEITVPDVTQAVIDWASACAVEAGVAHEATYPARKGEYGHLASVLEAGRAVLGLNYQKILLRRMDLRGRFARLFENIDQLLTPVHPFAPLSLAMIRTLGEQPDLILKLQRYTAPFDLTGAPTITLPGGFSDAGLPVGFQLIGRHWDEANLLAAGVAFQTVTTWHQQHPAI
jgi:amidase